MTEKPPLVGPGLTIDEMKAQDKARYIRSCRNGGRRKARMDKAMQILRQTRGQR